MSSYSNAVLADGAVGYWRLGDATPTYGPELVLNGEFSVDTSGWTHDAGANGTLTSVAGGQSGNCLSINTVTGAAALYDAYPNNSAVVVGQTYRLRVWVKSGTSGNETFRFTPIGYPEPVNPFGTSSGVWTQYTQYFVATGTLARPVVVKNSNTVGSMLFDGISMQLVTFPVALDAVAVPHNGVYNGGVELQQAGAVYGDTAARFLVGGTLGNARVITPAASTSPIDGTSAVSIETWFKPVTLTATLNIFLTLGNIGGSAHYINARSSGLLDAKLMVNGAQKTCSAAGVISVGNWYHVVVTFDGANMRLYLNGALLVTNPFPGAVTQLTTGLCLGNYDGGGFGYDGYLDEPAIYPVVLTPGQVANHYALAPVTFNPQWFEGSNAYVSVAP